MEQTLATKDPLGRSTVVNHDSPRRVGLLVVHGIGEQDPGDTRDSVVAGLKIAYPNEHFTLENQVGVKRGRATGPRVSDLTPEVRIYEVYWKDVLSGKSVAGSFKIELAQQLVWFPFLNWKYVANFAHDYPRSVALGWTAVLVPLGAFLTAAYHALHYILQFFQGLFDKPRESDFLAKLAARHRRSGLLHKFFAALRKDPDDALKRNVFDTWLDDYFGDIFNYVSAAGQANPWVPDAAQAIYETFRTTLEEAIQDQCTEIVACSPPTLATESTRVSSRFLGQL